MIDGSIFWQFGLALKVMTRELAQALRPRLRRRRPRHRHQVPHRGLQFMKVVRHKYLHGANLGCLLLRLLMGII